MSSVSVLPADVPSVTILPVRPWPDSVIDALGHDPRSAYVERFWLGVLGPSTTWLLRYVANRLDVTPEGFDLDLAATAQALVWDFTRTLRPDFTRTFDGPLRPVDAAGEIQRFPFHPDIPRGWCRPAAISPGHSAQAPQGRRPPLVRPLGKPLSPRYWSSCTPLGRDHASTAPA